MKKIEAQEQDAEYQKGDIVEFPALKEAFLSDDMSTRLGVVTWSVAGMADSGCLCAMHIDLIGRRKVVSFADPRCPEICQKKSWQ